MPLGDSLTDLTIVIPQYGQTPLTVQCLHSLRQKEPKPWPVIVVDDGSPERELLEFQEGLISDKLRRYQVVKQEHAGVTEAWNRGALEVTTRFVLFLNNDVQFHGEILDRFVNCLLDDQTRLVGTRWRTEPQLMNSEFRFLEGWALACRLDDFFDAGGFDESMAVYFSDTDFQLRLMNEYGQEALQVLDSRFLQHAGHRTAHRAPQHREQWRQDRDTFLRKWRDGLPPINARV